MMIRNIIYMTLAIIMELLNTITLKTRPNTTPAGPNCVNFRQCISQNNTTGSAFRWKTHFSQSTQDVKSNKKIYHRQSSPCAWRHRGKWRHSSIHP